MVMALIGHWRIKFVVFLCHFTQPSSAEFAEKGV